MNMDILGYSGIAFLPSTFYLLLLFGEMSRLGRSHEASQDSESWLSQVLLLIPIVMHGLILHESIFTAEGFIFGFAQALSMMAWIGVAFFWVESWYLPIHSLKAMILLVAAIAGVLPEVFPGYLLSARAVHDPWFRAHFIVANVAYGLLSLAALHAILMHWQDRRLHLRPGGSSNSPLNRWVDRLPPLLSMESMLFRIIGAGFALLTLTVFSGIFFSQTLFGKPLFWDHKTVFGLLSWGMFATLLISRWRSGLRGAAAIRWVLGSFGMLLLAYVGSRFVIEVLLQR